MYKEAWKTYRTRDFSKLQYGFFQTKENRQSTAFIIIHGITAEIDHHRKFADALQVDGDVFLPILRGYDRLNSRGDIEYMGQYDHDILDFIHCVQKQGYHSIVLVGHSMGCANILRLIDLNKNVADYYVFISPFFHPTLPVYQRDVTDQFKPETDVDYTVFDKKAMLLMVLHKMNISYFSKQSVAEIPDEFESTGRLSLSFRLIASRFLEKIPSDLLEGLDKRVHTYLGSDDEVIATEKFQLWYHRQFQKPVEMIEGLDHNHILHEPELHFSLAKWLKTD